MSSSKAVLFDLDGCLIDSRARTRFIQALHSSPIQLDAQLMPLDAPNPALLALWKTLQDLGLKIIVLTAREEKFRAATMLWLERQKLFPDEIFFRPADWRGDEVSYKVRVYQNSVAPIYEIIFAIDDREDQLAEWRRLGLTCLRAIG